MSIKWVLGGIFSLLLGGSMVYMTCIVSVPTNNAGSKKKRVVRFPRELDQMWYAAGGILIIVVGVAAIMAGLGFLGPLPRNQR